MKIAKIRADVETLPFYRATQARSNNIVGRFTATPMGNSRGDTFPMRLIGIIGGLSTT